MKAQPKRNRPFNIRLVRSPASQAPLEVLRPSSSRTTPRSSSRAGRVARPSACLNFPRAACSRSMQVVRTSLPCNIYWAWRGGGYWTCAESQLQVQMRQVVMSASSEPRTTASLRLPPSAIWSLRTTWPISRWKKRLHEAGPRWPARSPPLAAQWFPRMLGSPLRLGQGSLLA